jgi:hypothetical protein
MFMAVQVTHTKSSFLRRPHAPAACPSPSISASSSPLYLLFVSELYVAGRRTRGPAGDKGGRREGSRGGNKNKVLRKKAQWYSCLTDQYIFLSEPPVITAAPKNSTVLLGADLFLACAASGEPKPTIVWTFEGKRLDPSKSQMIPDRGVRLRKVEPHQSGIYVCKASSRVGTAFAKSEVYVQVPPVITGPPEATIVLEGGSGSARLECSAQGKPRPLVIWMHEEERTFLLPGDQAGNLEVTGEATLLVTDPGSDMQLVCFAVNYVGSAMSRSRLKTSSASEIGVTAEGVSGGRVPLHGGAQIMTVTGVTPTSIRVSWRLTHPLQDMANVDGFYVLYRQYGVLPEVGFTSLTVLHAAATSYVVNRLLPYTKYEFIVIPFQRGSPGSASALVEAHTMAVRPIGAATDLDWRQVNGSSVEIRWSPVSDEDFRGVPMGYRVSHYDNSINIPSIIPFFFEVVFLMACFLPFRFSSSATANSHPTSPSTIPPTR